MKDSRFVFARHLLILDVVAIALAWYPLTNLQGTNGWLAVIAAFLLTSVNAYGGYHAIVATKAGSMSSFMLTVFGGMMARMALMLAALALVVVATDLPEITFTIALFIAYICKSVMEMKLIHNESTNHRS